MLLLARGRCTPWQWIFRDWQYLAKALNFGCFWHLQYFVDPKLNSPAITLFGFKNSQSLFPNDKKLPNKYHQYIMTVKRNWEKNLTNYKKLIICALVELIIFSSIMLNLLLQKNKKGCSLWKRLLNLLAELCFLLKE